MLLLHTLCAVLLAVAPPGARAEAPCVLAPNGKMLCCAEGDAECLAKLRATNAEPEPQPPATVESSKPWMLGAAYTFANATWWDQADARPFDVAVVGMPFGTRPGYEAPGLQALRREVSRIAPYSRAFGRSIKEFRLVDGQDLIVSGSNRVKALEKAAGPFFKPGKPVLALGGDQTITVPLLAAAKSVFGQFALVHIDRDLSAGNGDREQSLDSSTAMFWAAAQSLIDTRHSLHVGTAANLASRKVELVDQELGYATVGVEEFGLGGVQKVLEKIKMRLARRDGTFMSAFVSLDLDVLDGSVIPGNDEDGLTLKELRALLTGLKDFCYVVGADLRGVAELSEPRSVRVAAKLAHDLVVLAGSRPAPMGREVVPSNAEL